MTHFSISSILRGIFPAPSGGSLAKRKLLFGFGEEAYFGIRLLVSGESRTWTDESAERLLLVWEGESLVGVFCSAGTAQEGDVDWLRFSSLWGKEVSTQPLPACVCISVFFVEHVCVWTPGTGGLLPSGGVRAKTYKKVLNGVITLAKYHLHKTFWVGGRSENMNPPRGGIVQKRIKHTRGRG